MEHCDAGTGKTAQLGVADESELAGLQDESAPMQVYGSSVYNSSSGTMQMNSSLQTGFSLPGFTLATEPGIITLRGSLPTCLLCYRVKVLKALSLPKVELK
jgi:hypothetical protein